MATGKFVAYYRVSTQKQGRSGLGLEAQKQAVQDYLNGGKWKLVAEFTEIESGRKDDRPELEKALHRAKVTGATLVVAKLDRLSRDAVFLLTLQRAGTPFVCCDNADTTPLTVGVRALVAQEEARAISERTKAALAAAKRRGVKLGNPNGARALQRYLRVHGNVAAAKGVSDAARAFDAGVLPVIADIRATGITTMQGIADELNAREILSRYNGRWHARSVHRLLERGVA